MGIEFREFRLEDLFGLPVRGTRLTKENRIVGDIPLVTAGEQNEGVAEYISNPEPQTFHNMITIDMFGNCFYRDYKYKADDNILSFKGVDSPKANLYIVAAIKKVTANYSYGKQFRLNSYLNTSVRLPVTPEGIPDWDYMDAYISELEQERISELDAYLKATGLEDYELTEEDREILASAASRSRLTKSDVWKLLSKMGRGE